MPSKKPIPVTNVTQPQPDPSFSLLANYIANQQNTAPSNMDVAKYILANSSIKFGTKSPIDMAGNGDHLGLLSRVVDLLSRPNYAVANAAAFAQSGENPIKGFARGLEGKDKTTFSDVLGNAGIENPVVKGLGGFALDVGLDPTTYIAPGTIAKGLGKAGKLVGIGKKAVEELPEKPVEKIVRDFTGRSVPESATEHPTEVLPVVTAATREQQRLVNTAAEVVPDALPKSKPNVHLNPNERFAVDDVLGDIPSSRARVNTDFPDSINPTQQLNIWKKITAYAKAMYPKNAAKQFESSYQMLIHAENQLESGGRIARYWDGGNFKLSDMVSELVNGKGVKFARDTVPILEKELRKVNIRLKDPNITQAFHNVRVRGAILDSEPVRNAIDAALNDNRILRQEPLSDARLNKLFTKIPQLAARHAIDMGSSGSGADAASNLTREVIAREAPPRAIESGGNDIKKAIDITDKDLKQPLSGRGKVEESIGARIFSWYGQKLLRPITEQHLLTASNSSWMRSAALKRFSSKFTLSQQLEAIRFAQGIPTNTGIVNNQLGPIYKQVIENLFKGSGLTDAAWKEASVSGRAGLLMDRLNLNLKRVKSPFQFTDGVVSRNPITGLRQDFTGDSNWLKSWQSWNITDPQIFFPMIQGAVETATHEKAIFDEIADRFGSKIKDNGYEHTFNHPYLNGVYFTKDVASQIPRVIKDMNDFFDGGANSKYVKLFDKISRAWKFSVTLPNPAHHIRNLLGDSYLNWMAGVNSVRPYNYALQILRSQRHNYEGLNDVQRLVDSGAVDRAMAKTPSPKDVLFTNKSGHPFTAEQIYVAAHNMGILPQAHVIEDILGVDQPLIKGFSPFKGKLKSSIEKFSETREHFARLAHFTDIVRKSSGTDFQNIFKKAGYEVRKWHPDYLTLTPFEKKFLRRIMPFYSWTRRAIPLVIESAILNPGKTLVYPKAMQAIQTVMGIDVPSRTDPFPTNQRFPEWIRDLGVGPIFDHPALGARSVTDILGNQVGDTIVNPSNPTFDIGSQFSNPLQGVGGLLHPAIKIPIELLTQKQINTGGEINSGNLMEYLGNQLPFFSTIQGLTGVTPALGQTSRAQKEGNINTERLINFLTALGVRGTGPYIKQAQIEQGGK